MWQQMKGEDMPRLSFVFLFVLALSIPAVSRAEEAHTPDYGVSVTTEEAPLPQEGEPATEMVKVGNKICPVSKEAVGEMGEPYEVAYNGRIYNLCCSSCAEDFMKDPEKYSKIADQEVAGEAQAAE
jgi:YHS domain-containing protein